MGRGEQGLPNMFYRAAASESGGGGGVSEQGEAGSEAGGP